MMKYLKLLLMLRNVADAYQDEKGQSKPWYLSRRFYGVVLLAIASALAMFAGVTIPEDVTNHLADALLLTVQAAIGLYGAIAVIIGHIKKAAKPKVLPEPEKDNVPLP